MDLTYLKTHNGNSYIVNIVQDELRERLQIVFGYSLRLYCEHIITDKNTKGTDYYSNYINSSPVQLCFSADIIDSRKAKDEEIVIYNMINNGTKLSSTEHDYLKNNYLVIKDNRSEE